MKQYRYPGAQPFSTAQEDIFFGRDDDIARLHRLIKTEALVVLYSKSGMGKSSLLNAGIIPAVRREGEYTPLHIRFNAWTEGKTDLPADITYRTISPGGSRVSFLDSLIKDEKSLWHELKEAQLLSGGRQKYLLIFDQFEELFTYPPEAIAKFRDQLSEALYTKIPQRYRAVLEHQIEQGNCQLRDEEFDQLQEPYQVRIVLSIRSDRMHLMDRLSGSLPNILAHCYELDALSPAQAAAAVAEPARQAGDFTSAAFTYSAGAIQHLLHFLDDEEGRIETIQLQILCRTFEERVIRDGIRHFEQDTLGDLDGIIADFYHRQLAVLGDPSEQYRARLLIEEGLIVPEEHQRLTLHEAQIASLFQVPREHLALLVNGGLLRAEPALRGGYAYELSHDTLVAPALQARQKRRENEAALARRRQAQEVADALEKERSKRRQARNAALVFGCLALLALAAAAAAWIQTEKAKAAEDIAWRKEEDARQERQKALDAQGRADKNANYAKLSEQKARTEKERAERQQTLAEAAEHTARQLAAKGDQLERTISSADTYGFLMEEGFKYLSSGDYRNALTYFATARFTDDNIETNQGIVAAKTGLRAEQYFSSGALKAADEEYRKVQQAFPDNSKRAQQRRKEIVRADSIFQVRLKGRTPTAIRTLKLDNANLTTLPETIGTLAQMDTLDLSYNTFRTLPPAIGRLTGLKTLILKNCRLQELPPALGSLTALTYLDLFSNAGLRTLPVEIGKLHSLRVLNADNCGIETLPAAIGQLDLLEKLNLTKTKIRELPPEISALSNLKELKINQIEHISCLQALPVIFRLTHLERLEMRDNRIKPEHLAGISKLSTLAYLDLEDNGLNALPAEIANLKQLKTLKLAGNSFDETTRAQISAWLPGCRVEF